MEGAGWVGCLTLRTTCTCREWSPVEHKIYLHVRVEILYDEVCLVSASGSAQESCDSLSYKTLMNVDTLKSYMDMLRDTHWLVVMGTKGTCKTSLASGLARHLSMCLVNEEEVEEEDDELMVTIGGEVINYNIDKDGLDVRTGGCTTQ